MIDWTARGQGYEAGYKGQDERSNPYESTHLVLSWIEGYREGEAAREKNEND